MFAIRNLLRNNVVKSIAQQRNMSVVVTPARNKVSTGEMVVLASAMVVGWSVIPIWVLVNIKHYKHHE